MKQYLLYIIYPIQIFLIYSILRYFYYVIYYPNIFDSDFFIYMRLLFSGPLLIVIGIALVKIYNGLFNKIMGWISISIGSFWLILLLRDIVAETGV